MPRGLTVTQKIEKVKNEIADAQAKKAAAVAMYDEKIKKLTAELSEYEADKEQEDLRALQMLIKTSGMTIDEVAAKLSN